VRILSVDGGGYLGLATAAFVEGVEDHFDCNLGDCFDLFCGTSTGAIIALGIAAGKTGAELRTLYSELGKRVLVPRFGRRSKLGRLFGPKFALEPLREALTGAFGDLTLGDLYASNKRVIASSFCLTTGQPRIFKTDHSANLTRHARYRLVDVALASAAAPTYFPLAKVVDPLSGVVETFCDGGVVANQPALLAYAEAVSECGAEAKDVRLLSLSTPRADLAQKEPISTNRGLWQWGEAIADVFIEGSSRSSGEVLKRLVACCPENQRPLYERIELVNTHRLAFDDASPMASQVLIHEGSSRAASNVVRQRLMPFFTEEERNARLSR